tara:strand:+ start:2313 stop:3029 length:717 start_codon:yes stop_codon:yes gene_type:complete
MKDTPAEQPSIEQRVNTLTDSMAKNEEGNWALPADSEVSEEMAYAAMTERRRRDSQAEYGKGRQQIKALEAENQHLVTGWEQDVASKLTKAQREDLDQLKHDDPDAWRVKLNDYEQANRTAFATKTAEIKTNVQNETELEKRTRLIDEHNTANPALALTDDVIDNDLPPRFMKRLSAGETDFETFLAESVAYLSKGKVFKTEEAAPGDPSLSKAAGSSRPTDTAVEASVSETYKDELY